MTGPLDRWITEQKTRERIRNEWGSIVESGLRLDKGSPGGPVLVEFNDYECPHCVQAEKSVSQLLKRDPRIVVLYQPFPLAVHPHARAAALAAICADEQGRFAAMHEFLYTHRQWTEVEKVRWDSIALEVGVRDVTGFSRCMVSKGAGHRLRGSVQLGKELGVGGTPTFVTLRGMVIGAAPATALGRLVGLGSRSGPERTRRSAGEAGG